MSDEEKDTKPAETGEQKNETPEQIADDMLENVAGGRMLRTDGKR